MFHSDDRIWPDDPDVPESYRRRDQLAPSPFPPAPISRWATTATTPTTAGSGARCRGEPEGARDVRLLVLSLASPDSPGGAAILAAVLDFFARTRWERTFLPVR